MTYLRMYCKSFPIVLKITHSFSKFEETLTHFNPCVAGGFFLSFHFEHSHKVISNVSLKNSVPLYDIIPNSSK
jgi:hypothetical protein